ncbi:MAG: uroporphyrinogen-III synthase [Sphingosinicella sp.]
MKPVLVLRPQPGADRTAERARALGLVAIVAPLFTIETLAWEPPDRAGFDAVMLTSAQAARIAGARLAAFHRLPCYAVGEATAGEAARAGFGDVRTGPSDAAALAAMMAGEGVARALHPCGEHHVRPGDSGLDIVSLPVYSARAEDELPRVAEHALGQEALVLLHSPRAAATLASLIEDRRSDIGIAAISPAAAAAAGSGWRSLHVAERPRDAALLELARRLCQNANP